MASVTYLLLLLTTLVLPRHALSQTPGNITVGASLAATETSIPWRSPSGDFAFGFQQLQDDRDLFLLSTWFDKIPDKTVVWFNRNINNPVPRGSTVQLTAADGLVLRDPQGRLIFTTNGGLTDEVGYAFLNDTGNLILRRRSDSAPLWESFKNPSDTILPTQTLEIDTALVSRKSEKNFSQGRFSARMNGDGNFVFNTKSVLTNTDFDDEYYNSRTSDQNASISGFQVVFNERASIYILRRNGGQVLLSPRSIPPPSDFYYRATLDFDGVFTQYYHPKTANGNQRWTAARSWPDNICFTVDGGLGSGACGYNSVCRLENQKPVCQCPRGFSLADPNNTYGDCRPNFVQSCVQSGDEADDYELLEISDTDWPLNDYQQIKPSTADECKSACLNDCFCAVAIYRSESCWKKKLPLSNGRVDTSLGSTAFLKFRKSNAPLINPNPNPNHNPFTRDKDKNRQTLIVVGSALLGSSVFINFLLITSACLIFFFIYNKKTPISDHNSSVANLRCFTYKELVQATNAFEKELGRGAFGIVYKGSLPNHSKTLVAVKKLDGVAHDSEKEFRAEVNAIGQTHHKNLVHLIGFCDEGINRLLVYEYMSKGTLSELLFGKAKPKWSQRIQIALGVARGLTYLHEECVTQIIHCDIKPQNILLDDYYNARISDFGLAKLLVMDQSKTITNIRGTKGYVAPEWFRNAKITAKVDVYSFGVLLLEMVSCRKSLDFKEGENPIILTDWAWDCFLEGRIDCLVDKDEEALSDVRKLERFVMVGLWCVQEDATLRPTMKKACQMLEGVVEVATPPNPYLFTSITTA